VANRLTRRVRTAALVVGALGATVVALPTVAGAQPQSPKKPQTIEQVQKELGSLALENSQLIEQYDQGRIQVEQRQAAAARAQHAANVASAHLRSARAVLGQSFSAMYEGGSFSTTGALLTSESGASYLSRLDTMSMISQHNAQLVREVTAIKKQAAHSRDTANSMLADARATLKALAAKRADVQAQVDKYKNLLATLTAAQRAAFFAAQHPTATHAAVQTAKAQLISVKGTPAAAQKAVQFALAQVGKPYVWGAAGPSSYDCSGLTMAAYRSAGISLPHSAAQQYGYGHHVSFSELRPGDLIFLYSPIGHVEMYIGDGLAVSAPTSGEDVKVISVSAGGDYTGATRLVG
jgi:cell wall-associated NlpC family hydrolase